MARQTAEGGWRSRATETEQQRQERERARGSTLEEGRVDGEGRRTAISRK